MLTWPTKRFVHPALMTGFVIASWNLQAVNQINISHTKRYSSRSNTHVDTDCAAEMALHVSPLLTVYCLAQTAGGGVEVDVAVVSLVTVGKSVVVGAEVVVGDTVVVGGAVVDVVVSWAETPSSEGRKFKVVSQHLFERRHTESNNRESKQLGEHSVQR